MTIGHAIIAEIVKQKMFQVRYPDADAAHVIVWSSGAPEQLEALVASKVQPKLIAALENLAVLVDALVLNSLSTTEIRHSYASLAKANGAALALVRKAKASTHP